MFKQITRLNPSSSLVERPWRNRDHNFVLAEPNKGAVRHRTKEHGIYIDNYGEAAELVERGFSIRMSDGRSAQSLVSPRSLTITVHPVARLDDLWTYTMPTHAFTRDELERDIRSALTSTALETYWIAGPRAADALVDQAIDIDDIAELEAKLDLSAFNFARVVFAAYESAFRVGQARLIGHEDVDELEIMIGAMVGGKIGASFRRYPNPADHRSSALHRTMLSAYLRWQISEFGGFDNDKLDESAVEKLALLAGMTDQAVRNSLNKEGLSAKGPIDYPAVIRWLEHRQDFVPFREDERPAARATWNALHLLRTMPVADALALVRARKGAAGSESATQAEAEIIRSLAQQKTPLVSVLRQFARDAGLLIDTFVSQFPTAINPAASTAAA